MVPRRLSRRVLLGTLTTTTTVAAVVALALLAVACAPMVDDDDATTLSTSELGIEISRSSRGASPGSRPALPTTTVATAPADPAPQPSPQPHADTFVTPGERLGVAGCALFPRDHAFHASIGRLEVHPRSDRMIAAGGGSSLMLNAGFSAAPWEGARPGYPVNIADSRNSETVGVVARRWADTSDLDGHPVPVAPRYEGWPSSRWDRHLLVVDPATCTSHEMISVSPPHENVLGAWVVDKAVRIDLGSNEYRARGTVKVAGVSMLAGLVRYDEVASGRIGHVLSMSMPDVGDSAPVWPARFSDGTNTDPEAPPMGTWVRLRPDADLSGLGPQARVIAQALRDHGAVLVDTGGRFSLSGEPDTRWDDADLRTLRTLSLASFEVVDPAPMITSRDSLRIR